MSQYNKMAKNKKQKQKNLKNVPDQQDWLCYHLAQVASVHLQLQYIFPAYDI